MISGQGTGSAAPGCSSWHPKVARDARSAASIAIELDDKAALQSEQVTWERLAKQYLRQAVKQGKDPHEKAPERRRTKALEWLLTAHAQLEAFLGFASGVRGDRS